jgi:two-component system chemotaxis response regulator CheY
MQTSLQGTNCNIMIVDDSSFMRNLLSNIIRFLGFQVIAEAQNGYEAVEKYIKFRPDVTLIDVSLPHKDGLDPTTEIIFLDENAKVVMCSSLEHVSLVVSALKVGARDVIYKPYKADHINKVIKKLMQS